MSDQPVERRFLFLCGVGRSGTTALGTLMNLHPRVAVGVERYKLLAMRSQTLAQFTPALFSYDRFFSFEPQDTNVKAVPIYEALKDKYRDALYVGDKVPRYYTKLRILNERFDRPWIIYIVREPGAVARSWNARADNPKDGWPADNDYRKAVAEWNAANRIALSQLQRTPERFLVVCYDDLFPFGIDVVSVLFERLGLALDADFLSRYSTFSNAPRQPGPERRDRPGQDAYIQDQADWRTYEKLREGRLR